ncbi:MAG: mechanosensitive ion channel [Proteobacteria bacterium]|nr:mechanosensitive ion channel [Pseudomonadota bacterium]
MFVFAPSDHPVLASSRLLDRMSHIDWPELSLEWGVRAGEAVLLLIGGIWLSKWISRWLGRLLARLGVQSILANFLRASVRALCMIVAIIAAMDALGLPTTSLLAVLGAAGLGIGLALKDSLANIASGFMLIVLRPFNTGDEVQAAGTNGVVEQVRIFQTVLRTSDNRVVFLPNGLITAAPIINFTARDRRCIELTIGIGYEDDIRNARDALVTVARAHPRVLPDPQPDVLVSDLAAGSINLTLRAWVATGDFKQARSDLLEATRAALRAAGVGAPFPQHGVHVFHHETIAADIPATTGSPRRQ